MRSWLILLGSMAIGIGVAFFFAPQSGKKNRRNLNKRIRKMKLNMAAQKERRWENLNKMVQNAEQNAEDYIKNMNGSH